MNAHANILDQVSGRSEALDVTPSAKPARLTASFTRTYRAGLHDHKVRYAKIGDTWYAHLIAGSNHYRLATGDKLAMVVAAVFSLI